MYQLGATNYAADFFREQEDLKTSKTNRTIAQAQEMRANSLFTRQQEVQAITDKTLQNLSDIGRGRSNSTQRAVEELAQDALADGPTRGIKGFNDNPVQQSGIGEVPDIAIQEKPQTIKLEPLDISLGKMADTIGDALMRAGYGAEGMAYAKEGIDYTAAVAEAEEKRASAQIKKSKDYIEVIDYMYEGLGDVKSQEDQDRFFQSLPEPIIAVLGPQNVEQMRQLPYSPEVVEHYRERALSTKDMYDLNMKAEDAQLKVDREAALAFDKAARTKIADQRRRDQLFIAQNKDKASGKNSVTTATGPEIGVAKTQIVATVFKGQLPKKGSPDDVIISSAAASIASEAKQMAKDNPGLTYDEALTRVVTLHRGDFIKPTVEVSMQYEIGGFKIPGTKSTEKRQGPLEFKPMGSSKERPIVLNGREQAGKLVPGKWYTHNGRTMQYNPD